MNTPPVFSQQDQQYLYNAPISIEKSNSVIRWSYIWMFFGLLVTTAVSWVTYNNIVAGTIELSRGLLLGAIVAQLGIVIGLSWAMNRIPAWLAALLFMVYAAVTGFTLSTIFIVYTSESIISAFGTTAVLFGIMTVYGLTTKADLSKWGTYLMIGLIGIIVASVINIFIGSSSLQIIVSIIGVIIFTGLTAYDTQWIKNAASHPAVQQDDQMALKVGIMGALKLYLDFINLFLMLLRIFGGRRS